MSLNNDPQGDHRQGGTPKFPRVFKALAPIAGSFLAFVVAWHVPPEEWALAMSTIAIHLWVERTLRQ